MRAFWIKFDDGSEACCEGGDEFDAMRIAEKVTGKTVSGKPNAWSAGPNVRSLPYPATPCVWQLDHPVYGKTPHFCHAPSKCAGRTSCPQRYSCTE